MTTSCPDCRHPEHAAGQCENCDCGISEICHLTRMVDATEMETEQVHHGGLVRALNRGHRVKPHKRAEDLDK